MKIVHISFSDYLGGAARATYRLHVAMLKLGIESSMVVQSKFTPGSDATIFEHSKFDARFLSLLRRNIEDRQKEQLVKKYGFFSPFSLGIDIAKNPTVMAADIIYLHWINRSFINSDSLRHLLGLGKPVFWYLHDMFPITGGCHHSYECVKYKTECSYCPYFKRQKMKDLSYYQFHTKKKIYASYDNLSFIAPSRWMQGCAVESALSSEMKIHIVPNTLDMKLFKHVDAGLVRTIFNIGPGEKIILFGADSVLQNRSKGFDYFLKALEILSKDEQLSSQLHIALFGASYDPVLDGLLPFKLHFMGTVFDDLSLMLLFNLADVYVTSSLAESFGLTALESLACGTPVACFTLGGLTDIVTKENGYLAVVKDAKDLALGITKCIRKKDSIDTSDISATFSEESVVSRHIEIWKLS